MNTQVLTVSSKGQISLPVEMRRQLSIETGDKLAAYASDNYIMLKVIKMPTQEEFEAELDEAKKWAEEAGYSESDISGIISEVRARKKKNENSN